ncbi:bile salt-activated lipase [Patella vulgata]|uniref:bile salt-activated lipase n=1 Tax=Patella vulgata TaxID=6465 RepID=UPI0024A93D92|nr:bile salt-activated lipase [Patella vulgata]
MIFIHGGGFVVGQSSSYSGDILAAYGQVIVVTINYRVGPFGFLSTGDDQAPGNYGLWDQHLAIQWVKNNIASFGGDTSRITIFGESSGSASVMYQTLFAGNNGLFQRAIAISGSATANWASVPKDSGLEYAKNLAIKFNCSVTKETESDEILKCLRSIDNATEIATTEVNSVWAPTPDNDFIREDVIASIKWPSVSTPNYQEFDLMLGTNGYEGHFFLHTAFPSILSTMTKAPITELRELFKNLVKITLPEVFSRSWEVFPKSLESMDQVVDAVMFAYSASENPNNRDYKLKQICDFLTDVQVFIPTVVDARNHAYMNNRTKTYHP